MKKAEMLSASGVSGIALRCLATVMSFLLAVGTFGCGSGKGARSRSEEVGFESEEGGERISVRREPPPLEEIGLPLYPGSEYVEGSGGSYTAEGEKGRFESKSLAYQTTDSFDRVLQWYRERLGDPTAEYSTESEREAHWSLNEGENVTLFLSLRGSQGIVLIEMGRLAGSPTP